MLTASHKGRGVGGGGILSTCNLRGGDLGRGGDLSLEHSHLMMTPQQYRSPRCVPPLEGSVRLVGLHHRVPSII